MKIKLLQLIFLFCIILSCKKETTTPIAPIVNSPTPTASFTVSSNEDGVTIFTNTSKDADTFEWDFGDTKGKSTDKNPTYQFAKSGKYKVVLKATGKGGTANSETETEIKLVQLAIAAVDSKIEAFLEKYSLTGASLAISKNGKMVYAKGFGFADKAKGEKVNQDHIFRLASISKTYTGVAILKLIQDGKLKIDDKVFGEGGVLGKDFGTIPVSANLSKITVNQLLHHTAGAWGSATGGDVIDQNPNYNFKQFYDWVLDTRPLPKEPDSFYDYTNIGFNMLGRIIEKVSKKSYINFIKEDIVGKIGGNIELAGKTLGERKTNEVVYHGLGSDAIYPYVIAFPRRDADGGLVTSAIDLLKFVNAIDGFPSRTDILDSKSLAEFTKPSSVFANYGCGVGIWEAQKVMYSYGSLPGTRTSAMWGQNGVSVVLLLNSRVDPNITNPNAYIFEKQDILLDLIKNATYKWQTFDLFN
jgi:D-alanyl-D-alanine carboxypeptidase